MPGWGFRSGPDKLSINRDAHAMLFKHVCLEALGYSLPSQMVTTQQLETQLEPLYTRLKLPPGRLELMTGILERRFWPAEMAVSVPSIESGRRAIEAADFDPQRIGLLVHGSVCRDQLEPATACRVHQQLGLPHDCLVYDTSNACLGMLNGLVQAAALIELGQIEAALVVGTENGTGLVENTIQHLNHSTQVTRRNIKSAIASLTIGSASAAMLLTHANFSRTGTRIQSVVARADTQHYELCQGDHDPADGQNRPLMQTDSENLMAEGFNTGQRTFKKLLAETGWQAESIGRSIGHQVGMAHRKGMLERLSLDAERDFATVEWLGNTGACALPVSLAIAAHLGALPEGGSVALLGIGSGINCIMAGLQWQPTPVGGPEEIHQQIPLAASATWDLVPKIAR